MAIIHIYTPKRPKTQIIIYNYKSICILIIGSRDKDKGNNKKGYNHRRFPDLLFHSPTTPQHSTKKEAPTLGLLIPIYNYRYSPYTMLSLGCNNHKSNSNHCNSYSNDNICCKRLVKHQCPDKNSGNRLKNAQYRSLCCADIAGCDGKHGG